MNFFVTGANGFVGKLLVRNLLENQHKVVGAVRNQVHVDTDLKLFAVGDINAVTDWTGMLDAVDVVLHLAARVHIMNDSAIDPLSEFRKVNVDGTLNLARQAVKAGVKRFVYVSSIGVNGLYTFNGGRFNERDLPDPHDAYAISKWEAEQSLIRISQATGLEVVIVRPPLVYGKNAPGNFLKMISVVTRGVPLPFASVNNKRSLIYVENLVSALILCATHPAAPGNTYLVSDGEDLSTSDLLKRLAFAMHKQPRLFLFPICLLKLAANIFGKTDQLERLLGSLQVDSSKIRHELGWIPPFSVSEGLQATVNDRTL